MKSLNTLFTFVFCLFLLTAQAQDRVAVDVPDKPTTTIEFEQDVFNFGTISQGEKVKNVFVFTNTGDVPLIISNAKGSCGCTVPEWPREPIMPGESEQLIAVFDSKGKRGATMKKITITANTEPANTFLSLKGTIDVPEKADKTVSRNNSINEDALKIYPNPTSQYVNIEMEDYHGEKAKIEIFDQRGKLMSTNQIDEIENRPYNIDLSNYASGIYTATIIVGDKMRLAKQFVVK